MAGDDEPKSPLKDRRIDTRERLRYAIRRAHDRLFSILRPHENGLSGADNPDRVDLDQQLREKKRVNADEG